MESIERGAVDVAQVTEVGLGYQHAVGFEVDRPNGFADILFVQFLVPAAIRIGKQTFTADAHSCIIFSHWKPHWYEGDGVGLSNHWFSGPGPLFARLLAQYQIPTDRVLKLLRTDFVVSILTELRGEVEWPSEHSSRHIELLLERLCIQLSRSLNQRQSESQTPRQHEIKEAFLNLWNLIHSQPQEPWTVESMASGMKLSPSRFSTLYRQLFGVSAYDDVLNARLDRAKWLLTSTMASVTSIAEQCGFESIYNFSRAFSRRIGCSPVEFRSSSAFHSVR